MKFVGHKMKCDADLPETCYLPYQHAGVCKSAATVMMDMYFDRITKEITDLRNFYTRSMTEASEYRCLLWAAFMHLRSQGDQGCDNLADKIHTCLTAQQSDD